MKYFIIVFSLLLSVNIFGQTPQKMSMQALIKQSNGQPARNSFVSIRISIVEGTLMGNVVYSETHNPETDRDGIVSIAVGEGNVLAGNYSSIEWAKNSFFIKIEADPDGGTNYELSGVNQLLTVPYAHHSTTADSLTNGESDPVFNKSAAGSITNLDINKWNENNSLTDSATIAGYGFVAGPHTQDTRIDSTGIAALGFVAGSHELILNKDAIVALGFVPGSHTIDTQLDSSDIAAMGFIAVLPKLNETIDSAKIASFGYVAGPHTLDTQIDSAGIANLGYAAG
ncbi:MAG: hypothetical protein WBA74_06320, partial [Cyclobacteriaceae bacterium]